MLKRLFPSQADNRFDVLGMLTLLVLGLALSLIPARSPNREKSQ